MILIHVTLTACYFFRATHSSQPAMNSGSFHLQKVSGDWTVLRFIRLQRIQ